MSLPSVLAAVLGGLGAIVGIRAGTEEPRFTVVERVGPVEIRRYAPRLAAEVDAHGPAETARNQGFQALAAYIFGQNTARYAIAMTAPVAQAATQAPPGASGSQAIAMTAPVAQSAGADGSWRIRFYMPARYTLDTLPRPKDPAVRIVTVPAETYAVLRFTGDRDAAAVEARNQDLRAALAGGAWRLTAEPEAWFYDPPWTLPFLRRNEVAAPVTPRSPPA